MTYKDYSNVQAQAAPLMETKKAKEAAAFTKQEHQDRLDLLLPKKKARRRINYC